MNSKFFISVFALLTLLVVHVHGDPVELDLEDEADRDADYWNRFEPADRAERIQTLMDKLYRRVGFSFSTIRRRSLLDKIQRLHYFLDIARNSIRDEIGSGIDHRDKRQVDGKTTVAPPAPSTQAPSTTTTERPNILRRRIAALKRTIERLTNQAKNVNDARRRLLFRQIDTLRSIVDRLMRRPQVSTTTTPPA